MKMPLGGTKNKNRRIFYSFATVWCPHQTVKHNGGLQQKRRMMVLVMIELGTGSVEGDRPQLEDQSDAHQENIPRSSGSVMRKQIAQLAIAMFQRGREELGEVPKPTLAEVLQK